MEVLINWVIPIAIGIWAVVGTAIVSYRIGQRDCPEDYHAD